MIEWKARLFGNTQKKEDRPKKYKDCLLVIKNYDCTDVIVGYWDGEVWEVDYGEEIESNVTKVTYWAYVPEPPKED